jgi:hypothetical protein
MQVETPALFVIGMTKNELLSLRKAFINKFTAKNLPQYRSVMGHFDFYGTNTHKGRLWEVIRPYNLVSLDFALSALAEREEVVVIWDDLHFKINNKLPKVPILTFSGTELSAILSNPSAKVLPDDIYVFDRELSFFVVLTHVSLDGFGRVCMSSLEDETVRPEFKAMLDL